MATKILTKQDFICWLDKEITDGQIILMTRDLTGHATVTSKTNEKKVTFSFAADAFKKSESVGDIAFGITPVLAFAVCDKKDVSDNSLELLNVVAK